MGVSNTPCSEEHAAAVITPTETHRSIPMLVLMPMLSLYISMLRHLTDKSSGLGPWDKEDFIDVSFSWGHMFKSHVHIDFCLRRFVSCFSFSAGRGIEVP